MCCSPGLVRGSVAGFFPQQLCARVAIVRVPASAELGRDVLCREGVNEGSSDLLQAWV